MSANRNPTPMTTPPTEHDQPPTAGSPSHTLILPRSPTPFANESRPSSDRDRVAVVAERYRLRLADELDVASCPADRAAWLLAAEDDEDFVRRVFMDFEERLDELGYRIVVVVEDDRLEAGRRQALYEEIVASGELLLDLAYVVKTDGGLERVEMRRGGGSPVGPSPPARHAIGRVMPEPQSSCEPVHRPHGRRARLVRPGDPGRGRPRRGDAGAPRLGPHRGGPHRRSTQDMGLRQSRRRERSRPVKYLDALMSDPDDEEDAASGPCKGTDGGPAKPAKGVGSPRRPGRRSGRARGAGTRKTRKRG